MERQKFKRWSCSMIREGLMQNFEDIDFIHCSTIWRCLKNEMRYKYKKLERKHAPSLTQGSYRKQLEGGLIQKKNKQLKYRAHFHRRINWKHPPPCIPWVVPEGRKGLSENWQHQLQYEFYLWSFKQNGLWIPRL